MSKSKMISIGVLMLLAWGLRSCWNAVFDPCKVVYSADGTSATVSYDNGDECTPDMTDFRLLAEKVHETAKARPELDQILVVTTCNKLVSYDYGEKKRERASQQHARITKRYLKEVRRYATPSSYADMVVQESYTKPTKYTYAPNGLWYVPD